MSGQPVKLFFILLQLIMEVAWVITRTLKTCKKLLSDHHPQTTNIRFSTGQMPFLLFNPQCHSTESNDLNWYGADRSTYRNNVGDAIHSNKSTRNFAVHGLTVLPPQGLHSCSLPFGSCCITPSTRCHIFRWPHYKRERQKTSVK